VSHAWNPPPLEWNRLRLKSRRQRAHKVAADAVARLTPRGASFAEWFAALPQFLGAQELREVVAAVVAARKAGRPVVFAFGAHVIKTGCSPLVVDLIERGVITAVASNGAGPIHDLELAETGATSEEVAETIRNGSFGMVHETCQQMNQAARLGADGRGLGRAVGELLEAGDAPYKHLSIFAAAARAGIPATVHVAIGTDTVHMHPELDAAALGKATLCDFRTICAVVARLGAAEAGQPGGVWLNVGSAVVLPEVFLKAVAVARNLGHDLDAMHTVNFDMLRHYRPTQNVLRRPTASGRGKSYAITGHFEIMLPLFAAARIEKLT